MYTCAHIFIINEYMCFVCFMNFTCFVYACALCVKVVHKPPLDTEQLRALAGDEEYDKLDQLHFVPALLRATRQWQSDEKDRKAAAKAAARAVEAASGGAGAGSAGAGASSAQGAGAVQVDELAVEHMMELGRWDNKGKKLKKAVYSDPKKLVLAARGDGVPGMTTCEQNIRVKVKAHSTTLMKRLRSEVMSIVGTTAAGQLRVSRNPKSDKFEGTLMMQDYRAAVEQDEKAAPSPEDTAEGKRARFWSAVGRYVPHMMASDRLIYQSSLRNVRVEGRGRDAVDRESCSVGDKCKCSPKDYDHE